MLCVFRCNSGFFLFGIVPPSCCSGNHLFQIFNSSVDLVLLQILMPCMTDDSLGGGLQRCGHRYCGAKKSFSAFSEISCFRKVSEKETAREWGAQSPSSCQRTHFPILGKVWSPGESCASYPEFFGLRKRWSLLSIVKAGKAKIPARLINVVRASHKNEEVPPLYKPQSAQGTGKQETASFQKWHISNFFWMGNTSLLFPFVFSGFYEIGFWRILNFFNFFSKNRYPTGFSVWGY